MSARIQPTTVFVTGGMSGIGKALATSYIHRGAHVAIFDLAVNDAVLDELSNERLHAGQTVVAYQASVTDFGALGEAVTKAVATIGAPQLALNCAGIQRAQPFDSLSAEHFEQVVQVNLIGSRNFAAAVLPTMEPGSRLALVSSMAGFVANYSYAAYSASKFGVIGLGRVLRLEYKPRGIAVSLVCPPEVDTPMVVDEMKNMHPASRRLKEFGGSLSLPAAITMILAGLDAGRDVIIPGSKAKMAYFCSRYLPDFVMNFIADRIVLSVLRKMKRDKPTQVESQ
ncbi:Dihydroanticapsin 7-dehydrogenase [Halioglobus japonicus]|nr:Dihydroanticapsin 7-dehydrogenase [Halioglobus japonicus]